ncbi:MAG: phosphoribosylamine--glycine ligase [Euryarchaeota archaeon]|nr:phosphoribosylamine--glycine ligase [Euryarchaeota archaeon]
MKVMLVGGGAREHAIAEALCRSEGVELYAVMGNRNPGILRLCRGVEIAKETEVEKVAEAAERWGVELAVVGPEAPLCAGVADRLEERGVPCMGPRQRLAMIEGSKSFCRWLMSRYRIPGNVRYASFTDADEAAEFIDSFEGEVAVKPAGLTGGKGVKVMGEHLADREEAKAYAKQVVEQRIGGGEVVIEEKLVGEEFTVQAFVAGGVVKPMPAVQDHKRAFEGDRGHNTGGMGSYSMPDGLLPFLGEEEYSQAVEIIRKTAEALRKETGEDYRGVLYGQFILGREVKLVEFNCRFGDPEAMNVLSLLDSSFAELCMQIAEGRLKSEPKFKRLASVCKYIVPKGYGVSPAPPAEISVDEAAISREGALLYYAAVNQQDGRLYTTTSRSVAVVGLAESLEEAERIAERATSHVRGEHLYHRRDIGTKELIERKLQRLRKLRGE